MPVVNVEVDGGVACLRLDNPPVNAMGAPEITELRAALVDCRIRDDVRVLVVAGGERTFAAGGDIAEFSRIDAATYEVNLRRVRDTLQLLEALPMPTIAAVDGPAVGGGMELALACDVRIAAAGTRFGFPESRLGLLAAAGGTQRLLAAVGKGRALELLYTGRLLDAAEAQAIGLVEQVVDGPALPHAMAMARELAAGSATALAAAKACVLDGMVGGPAAGLRRELEAGPALFVGSDAHEGVAAFLAKRPPEFA